MRRKNVTGIDGCDRSDTDRCMWLVRWWWWWFLQTRSLPEPQAECLRPRLLPSSPSSSSSHCTNEWVMSSGQSVNLSVCLFVCVCVGGEDETAKRWMLVSKLADKWDDVSSVHPSESHTVLISSVCFTSQCKCVCVSMWDFVCLCVIVCVCVLRDRGVCSGFGKQVNIGMFHSILKHAEHRTLNTYTEQLVLPKCSSSFFLLFFFVVFSCFRTEWL